ncbi:hypothetical protein [Micromonospora sp. NPDC005367]
MLATIPLGATVGAALRLAVVIVLLAGMLLIDGHPGGRRVNAART